MAFVRIRTIKGQQYRFLEERWRENGKVRSRSKSLGPVDGRKKKAKIDWLGSLMGGAFTLGPHVLKRGTGSPKYRDRSRESGRTRQVRAAKLAGIYRQFGVDMWRGQAMRATMALLTSEQRQEMWERQRSVGRQAAEERRSSAKERQDQETVRAFRDFEQRAAARVAQAQQTTVPPAPSP